MISPEKLRRYAHCAGAPDELLKQVAMLAGERAFQTGAELFHEGEPARRLMILESGKVDIVHVMGDGRAAVVDSLVEGDLMAWSALLEPHVLTASGVARTAGTAIEIDGEGMRKICKENPEYGLVMMTEVAKTLRARLEATRVQLAAAR
jgi:CRP-like cAMP-binding protein